MRAQLPRQTRTETEEHVRIRLEKIKLSWRREAVVWAELWL